MRFGTSRENVGLFLSSFRLQVLRCGTRRLMWLLTSSSQEASSQSWASSCLQSCRRRSLAASPPSRTTRWSVCATAPYVTHSETLSTPKRDTCDTLTAVLLRFSVDTQPHWCVIGAHRGKDLFTNTQKSVQFSRYACVPSAISFVSHSFFSNFLRFPLHLFHTLNGFWQGIALSWTQARKFGKQYLIEKICLSSAKKEKKKENPVK